MGEQIGKSDVELWLCNFLDICPKDTGIKFLFDVILWCKSSVTELPRFLL